MCKDGFSKVENCSVKCEADTAVECAGVGQTEGVLHALDSPAGMTGVEVKTNPGDAVNVVGKQASTVVDDTELDETTVCVVDDDAGVLHQTLLD
jgi:hypothetical protein